MTQAKRFSAEDYVLMAAWIDPTSGNKTREIHEMMTQAATTEAKVMGLVEAMEKIVSTCEMPHTSAESMVNQIDIIALKALSKFRGE